MRTNDRGMDGTPGPWCHARGADSPAERREELRRRVDEGYYLTPRVTWEVAKRIVARREL